MAVALSRSLRAMVNTPLIWRILPMNRWLSFIAPLTAQILTRPDWRLPLGLTALTAGPIFGTLRG